MYNSDQYQNNKLISYLTYKRRGDETQDKKRVSCF